MAQGLHNNEDRTSTTRPVPACTRDVPAHNTTAASGKRKVDSTGPESLPAAKKICRTGKEGHEKIFESGTVDKYSFLTHSFLRGACRSRYLPADGSIEDLRKRLRLHDLQISESRANVNETITSYTSSRAEPLDRYTNMLQRDLRKECIKRSLPAFQKTKADLRRCLRLYDAARALGLSPEESLEAQEATLQHSKQNNSRSVSPRRPTKSNTVGTVAEEVIKEHTLGNVSPESIVDSWQGPIALKSLEDDASRSTDSQASPTKDLASSSVTTQDTTQEQSISDIYHGPAATPSYATMSPIKTRSRCRSRSLKQHCSSGLQLRMAPKLAKQANNAGVKVEVDAEHKNAELRVSSSASPPSLGFIDLDSGSRDDRGQCPPTSTEAQIEARQREQRALYISPCSPRLVPRIPREIDSESISCKTLYTNHPLSLQQPLVSLLNLTIKDIKTGANESALRGSQMELKPLSDRAIKIAEKEEFNSRHATESPTWICCCDIPGYEVRQRELAEFSANCLYHVSQIAQRGIFTMKEYQEYLITQRALDQVKSCLCQKLSVDHPEHQVKMTQGGFILAQIWREQLTRRQSLTVFRPDMAAYRRKGILKVMHNILEDFMIELSSRRQRRALVLWARMEAMAWFVNTLPASNEWHHFQDWRRPRTYIMLFGVALLTTINTLLQQNLFKDDEPKISNLGLVLALFIQSTWTSPSSTGNSFRGKDAYKSPFTNDICVSNENGWAAEVVRLADQHGVRINGVKSIDLIVERWRRSQNVFEPTRDRIWKEHNAVLQDQEIIPPSEATSASVGAKEDETLGGTGQGVTVRAIQPEILATRNVLGSGTELFSPFCFLDLQYDPPVSHAKSFVIMF